MLRMLRVRILLGVAAVLAALAFAGHGLHTTEGLVSVAKYEPVLSSAQFRAPIANLEAQLFAPAPLSLEQRVRLAASVDEMREALLAGSDSHMARFSARELGTLAAMCRGPGSLGGAELARVRQNWMRIRSNLFDDASWFRFSEADPIAPAEEPRIELSERDRWVVSRLRPVLDRIDRQIERGVEDTGRLGEPHPDGTVDDGVRESWQSWAVDWDDDVARLRESLPEAPDSTVSLRVRFAWDSAQRALGELGAVTGSAAGGGRPPYAIECTRHFQNARRSLDSGRDWIAKAEDGRSI